MGPRLPGRGSRALDLGDAAYRLLRLGLCGISSRRAGSRGDGVTNRYSNVGGRLRAAFPSHAAKGGRRWRYYVSQAVLHGKVEGIGPVTAPALVAAVGDRSSFKNGRQFAAWLGLVPKQRSSGGRARLFGISKRGDRYHPADPRRSRRARAGSRQAGSKKLVARQNAAAATPERRRRRACQQECARRLELAHQRQRLRRQSFGWRSLKANPK